MGGSKLLVSLDGLKVSVKGKEVCSLSFNVADVAELLLHTRRWVWKDRGGNTTIAFRVAMCKLGLIYETTSNSGSALRNIQLMIRRLGS